MHYLARTRAFFSIAILALYFLTGCTITPKAVDGVQLQPVEGLLVLKCSSNASAFLSYLEFNSESTFGSRFQENLVGAKGGIRFEEGEKYVVIPLKAGDYMWSKLTLGNRYAWLQSSNKFHIHPNSITYIGDIRLFISSEKFKLTVTNRSESMRDYIKQNYPKYFESLSFETAIADLNL